MLAALRVGNFKAFAETQQVLLRPLTFVYGANSAGKSTIIHSLLLAHEAELGRRTRSQGLDIHRTEVGGDAVDLGGFRQYVHRREPDRRVEWAAELDVHGLGGRAAALLAPVRHVSVSVTVGIDLDDKGKPLSGAQPSVHAYEVQADGAILLRMSRRSDGTLRLDRLDHEHRVLKEVLKAIVETATTAAALQPADFEGLAEAIAELVPEVAARAGELLPAELMQPVGPAFDASGQATLFPVSRGRRKEDLAAAVRFFLPRALDDLMRGLATSIRTELSRLSYLGPLRSYPPRHLAFSQHHDPNWFAGGGYAWDVVRRDEKVRALVNAWLNSPDRLQTRYELVLRDLVGIDQLERPLLEGLERLNLEADAEDNPDEGTAGGSQYPVIKDPEAEAARLRDWIRSSDLDRLNELILVDRRSNTVVSHRDVGIGVSQVLPVLVAAYASSDQLLAIEQPEIHLHPAIQADLGDLFIRSALGGQQNQFLIETHSEHILLRIMRRMLETHEKRLPEGIPSLTPAHVSVLYVERDASKSIVREMPLNERGELVKAWPGGFFEEGLREVFA